MSIFDDKQSRPYVYLSAVLHVIIFVVLVTNVSFVQTEKMKQISTPDEGVNKEVIKAVAVQSADVQQEMARLDQIDKQKKQQEEDKQRKLQEELAKIRKEKEIEVQKVAEQKLKAQELKEQQDLLAKQNLKIKEELAEKKAEKIKIEEQAKKDEQLKVQAQAAANAKKEKLKKQQQELLTKLKKEQEQKLLESLQEEDQLLAEAGKRKAFVEKEIDRYIALQQAKVSRNWISRDSFLGQGLVTKLEIRLADDGRVINVSIVKASGNQALDISAKNAVMKASPLPLPTDESLRSNFRVYRFTFRPDELT